MHEDVPLAWRSPVQQAVRLAHATGRDMYIGMWQGAGLVVTDDPTELDPGWYVVHPDGTFERLPTHPDPFPTPPERSPPEHPGSPFPPESP